MAKACQVIKGSGVSGPAQLIFHQRTVELIVPNSPIGVEVAKDVFAEQKSWRVDAPIFVVCRLEKD
jgi:hypothetical protein